MPEAAVDLHRKAGSGEDDVETTSTQALDGDSGVYAVSQAAAVQLSAECNLGSSVAALGRVHALASTG